MGNVSPTPAIMGSDQSASLWNESNVYFGCIGLVNIRAYSTPDFQNWSTHVRNNSGADAPVQATYASCNSLPLEALTSIVRISSWSCQHTILSQATTYTCDNEMVKFEQVIGFTLDRCQTLHVSHPRYVLTSRFTTFSSRRRCHTCEDRVFQ